MAMVRRYDDDPALVAAAQGGDEAAFTTLFQRWFDPCFDVARRIVHDEETAAEVAQETFLGAWRGLDTLRDTSAFGGWVLRTSRNKALNRLDRERRSIAVDSETEPALAQRAAVTDVAAEVEANEHQDLVWAAAAALGERDASILDLHLRHGLDASELAIALDVTPNNAHQLLFRMKGKLAASIRAWVLFKGGDPECADLGRALEQASARRFTAATVKVIDRHVKACDDCGRRQAAILAPEAMFAAVPLLPAGAVLKARVANSLRAEGVPLGPDAASVSAPATGSGTSSSGAPQPPSAQPHPIVAASTAASTAASAGVPPASPAGPAAGPDNEYVADGGAELRRRRTAVLVVAVVLLLVGVVGLGAWGLSTTDDDVRIEVADGLGGPAAGVEVEPTPPETITDPAPTVPEPPTTEPPPSTAPPRTSPPSTPPTPQPIPPRPPAPVPPAPDTTAPAPPPPPPPPVIGGFRATYTQPPGQCSPGQFPITFAWSTTGANDVSISAPGGGSFKGGPNGTTQACAPSPGTAWTLTAFGSGGTATATAP